MVARPRRRSFILLSVISVALALVVGAGLHRAAPANPHPQILELTSRAASQRLTAEAVQHCASFPTGFVVATGLGAFPQEGGTLAPLFSAAFAPLSHPALAVLLPLVYAGRSRFEDALEAQYLEQGGDAGPAPETVRRYLQKQWQDSESRVRLPDGRDVRIREQGLGLGGGMKWGTLSSAHGYAMTVVVMLHASDYDWSPQERGAIESLASDSKLATLLSCLEGVLWNRE